MAVGTDIELVGMYIRHAKEFLDDTVVIAKLTPNVGNISSLALAAQQAGADGITAINTVVGMDIDCSGERPVFSRVRAGLSGPAILPIALEAVWRTSRAVDIPVFGAGGISTVEDARKFFMAGAEAVQVGTAVFYEPGLPERIVEMIEREGVPGVLPE